MIAVNFNHRLAPGYLGQPTYFLYKDKSLRQGTSSFDFFFFFCLFVYTLQLLSTSHDQFWFDTMDSLNLLMDKRSSASNSLFRSRNGRAFISQLSVFFQRHRGGSSQRSATLSEARHRRRKCAFSPRFHTNCSMAGTCLAWGCFSHSLRH